MEKLFPYPLMTSFLTITWLVLHFPFSSGDVVLGIGVALFASWATSLLGPPAGRIRFTAAIPRLVLYVLTDILRSNIAVARIILSERAVRDRAAGFVRIPLDLRNRQGLSVLAIIITSTPGTIWMEHDPNRNVLLIHVLDLVDHKHWIQQIKGRYESLLMEIFE